MVTSEYVEEEDLIGFVQELYSHKPGLVMVTNVELKMQDHET